MTDRCDIRARIDAALEKMRAQSMAVRSIYLSESDRKALNRAMSKEFGQGFKLHVCGYRDHIVRDGKKSAVYSVHGVATTIPKRLSPRVSDLQAAA